MRKFLLLICFVLGNFSLLIISFLFLTVYTTKSSSALDTTAPLENYQPEEVSYATFRVDMPQKLSYESSILAGDNRIRLIDDFYSSYHSPMAGLGKDIVSNSDLYQIPYYLVPAIGQCEGASGLAIPKGSYNTWGWGIYSDKITRFSSWTEAIEAVSKGIRQDYFDKGLATPEDIMAKYAPSSKGTWAACINRYISELR